MTDDLLTRLGDELAPTDAALDRIRVRIREEPLLPPHPARRRRRLATRVGLSAAGAAAVVLAAALSPFNPTSEQRAVPGPAAAQAALERAGTAAGQADWTPLGAGQYHHTMTMSIKPHIPPYQGDTNEHNDQPASAATSTEVFLDADGHGMQLRVMGGNGDPDSYVTPLPPDSQGRISGFTFEGQDSHRLVGSVADSLRYAYTVDVTQWPRSGADPVQRLWYRTPQGFVTGQPSLAGAIPKAGLSLGQRFQRDLWGAPLHELDQVNSAEGDQLDRLLDPMLGTKPDGEISIVGPLAQGDYDETAAWFAAQIEVQRAVKLLANAPLAPHVRTALFQRLARQDHVKLERNAKDKLGRSGTRITFEWILDEHVPAFTVTKEQLRQDAIDKQQPADGTIAGPERVRVKAHRSVGRWYQSIIIEESTGTILQNEEWADWRTSIPVPRVATTTRRPRAINGIGWNVGIRFDPGWYGTLGGTAYGIRERTTKITNLQTAACATTPPMCG